MMPEHNRIYQGDCIGTMRGWDDGIVQTCVTSPPYWGLRDYGVEGQLGLEKTPQEYVEKMVAVFREVRRVLRDDGTLWLNLGDSYAANRSYQVPQDLRGSKASAEAGAAGGRASNAAEIGLKPKDLVGIPWMVAFALRDDGWYLRSDIIWAKKNCMPESVTDRPTRSHEYLFLLAKSERYFYDHEAIREPGSLASMKRLDQDGFDKQTGGPKDTKDWNRSHRKVLEDLKKKADKQRGHSRRHDGFNDRWDEMERAEQCGMMRNKRDVWTIGTTPFAEAHFATFPPELIKPCIIAGAPKGGVVFDPFMGAGTTALVAAQYDRHFLGCELNPDYIKIAEARIAAEVAQGKLL
jgi:DNA modification methylase